MKRASLIYNPSAGRFPAGPLLNRAVRVLRDLDWEVHILQTQRGEDFQVHARSAVEAGEEAVFVAGGDGSVGRVAAVLAGSETALGVLPSGTANVWAQEIGLPRLDWTHWFALEHAAASLARGTVRLADLGECNGHSFLLWAGIGLDAQIVNSIEPRERWEKILATAHYATLVLWNSIGWEGIHLDVDCPAGHYEGRFLVAVASNIRAYAGGLMQLAPGAKIDDGLLDFWLVGGRSMRDVVMRVLQILLGTHVDAKGVLHFQSSEATFRACSKILMQFDGEPVSLEPPLKFRVRPKALRVLIPADAGPRLFSPADTPSKESA